MLTTATRTPLRDPRVPVFTIGPQLAATIAMAADPTAARTTFVFAIAVNLPLLVAGRLEQRAPDLPALRPAMAGVWALSCLFGMPQVLAPDLHVAAQAAGWSSLTIALVLHLVPGPWSRTGALFSSRGMHRVPRRHGIHHAARRIVPLALAVALVAFVPAPGLASIGGFVALLALVVTHHLEKP